MDRAAHANALAEHQRKLTPHLAARRSRHTPATSPATTAEHRWRRTSRSIEHRRDAEARRRARFPHAVAVGRFDDEAIRPGGRLM